MTEQNGLAGFSGETPPQARVCTLCQQHGRKFTTDWHRLTKISAGGKATASRLPTHIVNGASMSREPMSREPPPWQGTPRRMATLKSNVEGTVPSTPAVTSREPSPRHPTLSAERPFPDRKTKNATNVPIGRHRRSENVAQSSYLSQIGSFRAFKCRPIGLFVAFSALRLGNNRRETQETPTAPVSQG